MPTYEYKCLNNGHTFELFQTMNAEPIKHCPVCNGPVKRLIGTGAGPIFKGSGFYHTDYKKKSPESSVKKDEKSKKQEKKSSDKPKGKE